MFQFFGPGEHLFEQAASIQGVVALFTVRPDAVQDDREAAQYIGQVMGILRMMETIAAGNALMTAFVSDFAIAVQAGGQSKKYRFKPRLQLDLNSKPKL